VVQKIRGTLYYFCLWDDSDGAFAKYLDQKDDLFAGRKPRIDADAFTTKDLVNGFLNPANYSSSLARQYACGERGERLDSTGHQLRARRFRRTRGSATTTKTTAFSGASGLSATATPIANDHEGAFNVTASATAAVGATPVVLVYSLTNLPNGPAKITATAGTPQSATVNQDFAATPGWRG
jgi:hypothetical protein